MRSLRALLFLAFLAGCSSQTPVTTAAPTPAPIDVDSADRGQLVRVTLEAFDGTLMASTIGQDDAALEDETTNVPPWECDSRSHATWDHGQTVLAARSDELGENEVPGGWIGTLLSFGGGAIAVRSWTVRWGESGVGARSDELVLLSLPDLSMRSIYAPGGRLRLLGLVLNHALLIVSSADGAHHVVAVDGDGHEVARTDAITLTEAALATPTELGIPLAAPVDATSIALVCNADGGICIVRFDGTALTLTPTEATLGDGLVLLASGPATTQGDDCRALTDGAAYAPCPDEIIAEYADGSLPIDGVLGDDVDGDVALDQVRHVVVLDRAAPETDDDVANRAGAGVMLLDASEGGATDGGFEFLVRGDHVAVSYTRVQDTQAMTTRRDLAVALPPGSVEVVPASFEGASGYRVRVTTTFPIHYSHDCWQGFWVVRAWYEGGGEAFANQYAEYGYCD